jgi:hypothetical protein
MVTIAGSLNPISEIWASLIVAAVWEHVLGPTFDHVGESRPESTDSVAPGSLRIIRAGSDCARHAVPARHVLGSGRRRRPRSLNQHDRGDASR